MGIAGCGRGGSIWTFRLDLEMMRREEWPRERRCQGASGSAAYHVRLRKAHGASYACLDDRSRDRPRLGLRSRCRCACSCYGTAAHAKQPPGSWPSKKRGAEGPTVALSELAVMLYMHWNEAPRDEHEGHTSIGREKKKIALGYSDKRKKASK